MKAMMGITGVSVIAIYLASVAQWHGEVVATEHMMWLLGAAILGASVGLLAFDP